MASNFPTGPDTITNNVANSTLEVDTHPGLHNQLADAVMAIETQLLPGGTMNLGAHVAAADPHPGYLTQTEGDARYSTIAAGVPDGSITSAKIADGTIVAGDLADGAVTSAKILDGTIATADLANGAVTNAKLAADTARANLLVNGGFEVWSRGSGPFTAAVTFSADRWALYAPAGTISISKDTTNMDTASGACAAVVVTGSGGSGNPTQVYQYPAHTNDNNMAAQMRGRTVSFSARIRASVANACRLVIQGPGITTVFSSYHSGGGAYETLTVSATCPSGISGTGPTPAINFDANGTFYLDNAMLVVGSVPAEYAPLHPADDLARCLRYYEILGNAATTVPLIGGYQGTSANTYTNIVWGTKKAVTPTVTKNGTWSTTNANQPTTQSPTIDGVLVFVAITATGYGYAVPGGAGQNITVEANP